MWHTFHYNRPNVSSAVAQKGLSVLSQTYKQIRSQSHISLTSDFLKRPLSFSLQDEQCVEASGEGPAQQEEGPKVEMESWQKECDSLRKVTEGIQAVTGGRLRGKRNVCIGKER